MRFLLPVFLFATASAVAQPTVGGCPVFPADNPWNRDVSALPVHPMSNVWVNKINSYKTNLHPDWGSPRIYGIPYTVVPADQPMVPVTFNLYGSESDPGPYPFPANAPIEGTPSDGGDNHVLVIDQGNCKLYEVWKAIKDSGGPSWTAGCGAVFDLSKNSYRPDGWTSADAAGLPIFPGLVRYDEIMAGKIEHAVRFTVPKTQRGYIHPARHMASNTSDSTYPPMGVVMRLKASVNISTYPQQMQVLLRALKKYGMILADNGSAWFITGATDSRWNDDSIATLKNIKGTDFEAVYTGPTKHGPDPVGIDDADPVVTSPVDLHVSGPNPADRGSMLAYSLDRETAVRVEMYDVVGRRVAIVDEGDRAAGSHEIELATQHLAAGVYRAVLIAGTTPVRAATLVVAH